MNLIDHLVAYFNPSAGRRRMVDRAVIKAEYEAAQPSRLRKFRRNRSSPDQLVRQGAVALRAQARHLERNHDISRGMLRTLVNNVVGPGGIGVEPQPRRADGSIHEDYAAALRAAWRDWQKLPEVTQEHHWAKVQRLVAKTWFRDGEAFSQMLRGSVPFLQHGSKVPFSLELFEPDMVPMDYEDPASNIRQGIQRNAWGRRTGYYVYKAFPGDSTFLARASDVKRIPAENMLQVAAIDRIGQLRGVSEFASVITRIEDIKDYEESERVAAKLAARLTAYIKKLSPDGFNQDNVQRDEQGNPIPREIGFDPGTIIDGLQVGEEIGLIDTKRPNPNVLTFRQGQLRAASAGIGASYSSISRDYDGTYSSQRQELVEQWVNYAVLTDEFTGMFVQPVWEAFVAIADLSGVVPRPRDVAPDLADDAMFVGQAMPWIDPMKEALAWQLLVQCGFASEVEVMRKRGVNPYDVLENMTKFRAEAADRGLVLASDFANAKGGAPASAEDAPEPSKPDDKRSSTTSQAV